MTHHLSCQRVFRQKVFSSHNFGDSMWKVIYPKAVIRRIEAKNLMTCVIQWYNFLNLGIYLHFDVSISEKFDDTFKPMTIFEISLSTYRYD